MDIQNTVVCDHIVGNPPVGYKLSNCPRCGGAGNYGGPNFSLSGQIVTISGGDQLAQQIKKILSERMRDTGYGFDYNLLKGVISQSTILAVKNEILRCLNYLYTIQQREKSNGFYYNSNEELSNGNYVVNVQQLTSEPRELLVDVVVRSVSGAQISVTVPLRR
jgi:hypothetical protein